jgi:hypothetical protein
MDTQLSHTWLLLFPATYALHIAEEYWAGEGFHRWIGRVARITLSPAQFLSANAVLWAAMIGAVLSVRSLSGEGWIAIALATIVSVNGFGHLLGSLYTGSYSPGVATGLGLWVPLGVYTLLCTVPVVSGAQLWMGIAAGLLAQAIVTLTALTLGRPAATP